MESPKLDPGKNPDLEILLQQMALSPLPDDGFSSRVIAALPPSAAGGRGFNSLRRPLVCVAGAGAGLATAAWQGDARAGLASLTDIWIALTTTFPERLALAMDGNDLVLASLIAVAILSAAALADRPLQG